MRWFGQPWPAASYRAPICEDDQYEAPTPVGQRCIYCPDPITDGDRGVLMGASHDEAFSKDSPAFIFELNDPEDPNPVYLGHVPVFACHIDCLIRSTVGPDLAHVVPLPRQPTDEDLLPFPARLEAALGRPLPESRTCRVCGRTTHHPMDVAVGWCAACEYFTGDETRADLYALAANLRGPESTALFRRLDERIGVVSTSQRRGEEYVVLGKCPHGYNLDREFCPQGCRV